VKIQVEVIWVVTPCSDMVGYERFGGPCCLHLQGEDGGSKVLRNTTRFHNSEGLGLNMNCTKTTLYHEFSKDVT